MKDSHRYDRFKPEIDPALNSKLEEFRLMGYETVTSEELWSYLIKKKWKKAKEDIHLYEVVADVLSVQVGDFMNFATVEAFKLGDFSFENDEDRRELLK